MNNQKTEKYFLLILIAGIFVITYFIFKPFLYALVLAIVFSTIFEPVHKKILAITKQSEIISAFITTILVLLIVIAPLAFLGIQIFREATQLYSFVVVSGGATVFSREIGDLFQNLLHFFFIPKEFSIDFNQYLKMGLGWVLQNLGPFFADIAKAVLDVFIFLIALYYLFKDGGKLKKAVVAMSPLEDVYDEKIISKLTVAINSIMKGGLAVAIVQGLLTSIGFVLFGVPNAALWGTVAAIAALVPGIGTALVLVPTVLYLFFLGETFSAIGLLLWGAIAVGLIDNFLGPMLVGRGVKLHSFLILLSILGGISFFGPLGFILGPLVVSLLFASLDIFSVMSKKRKK